MKTYRVQQNSSDSKWYVHEQTNEIIHSPPKSSWRAANWERKWIDASSGFNTQEEAEEYLEVLKEQE